MRLIKELRADHLTMISVYLRINGEKKSLLESIPRDKTKGRFSIIAINPVHEIIFINNQLTIDEKIIPTKDPLSTISEFIIKNNNKEKLEIPFDSGAIGYVGYDVASFYENIGKIPEDELGIADIHFYVYETFVVFDHANEKITIIADNSYSKRDEKELKDTTEKIENSLKIPSPEESKEILDQKLDFTSNTSKEEYEKIVKKAKNYIHAGDMFQVVPSQRLQAKFTYEPFDYYRKLRLSSPSPYLYFIDFGETKIIGSSPESLISVKNGIVLTNPIAGTKKRGDTPDEDESFMHELLNDEKELAEHRMLVDLGRNDIGKISKIGSVHVPIYMRIEKYRFVMHITSVVEGKLKDNLNAMDALKSTLPAGTVSGAPKIRAMQRIYEFEKTKRGVYAGAIGYLSKNGNADFAIAIRTMILHKGIAYVQAGAGVVYDSDPNKEYLETLHKAKALLKV